MDLVLLDKGELLSFCIYYIDPFGLEMSMIVLGLFNKLHLRRKYDKELKRLLSEGTNQLCMILANTSVQTMIGKSPSGAVSGDVIPMVTSEMVCMLWS